MTVARMVLGMSLGFLLGAQEGRAEVFQSAETLKPGGFSLGVEPQVYLTGGPAWILNLHGSGGIAPGMDLGITWGLPLPGSGVPGTFGADLELGVLKTDGVSPSLSVSFGAHAQNFSTFFIDGTVLLSKRFRKLEPYVGLDCDLSLPPNAVQPWLRGVIGMDVRLARVTELLLEVGLGFPSVPSYLSFGLNFYI